MTRWRAAAPLFFLLCAAAGPIEVSLPLEGYYRPGKYIPIRFRASLDERSAAGLEFSAEGAIATRVVLSEGKGQGIAPLLLIGSNRQIAWRAPGIAGKIDTSLRSVGDGEHLVGFTTLDVPFAKRLFDEESIIPIRLDM